MNQNQLTKKVKALMLFGTLAVCSSLNAQSISTPSDLKAACENSPGNVVTIDQSSTVSLPIFSATPLQVNCGCTIIIANESTIAFELSNLQFAGPVSFQSSGKGEVKVIKSSIKSPSITFTLGGTNSAISTSESLLQATAGNVSLTLGNQAKMELYGRLTPSTGDAISATGLVNISAGAQFTGSITDMGIGATQGLQIMPTGIEPNLKVENVVFSATQGSVAITANGSKGSLEMMETGFRVRDASTITYGGEEATLKIIETSFSAPNFNQLTTGGVTIVAGSGNASNTKIEMAEVTARNISGNFSVTSSINGEKGNLKMEKSAMIVNGAIILRTGNLGSTEVKENSITSLTRITINTGAGGSCLAEPNRTLSAPVVESCTAALARNVMSSSLNEKGLLSSNKITAYPNPSTSGLVNINLGSNNNSNLMLTDGFGRVIRQWNNYNKNIMTITNLAPGYYNLKVSNKLAGKSNTIKFIVAD